MNSDRFPRRVPLSVYTLMLSDNCFYVGTTSSPFAAIKDHFEGKGLSWTQVHTPIEILQVTPNCEPADEEIEIEKLMRRHGLDRVRGGSGPLSALTLSSELRQQLRWEIWGNESVCYHCGSAEHAPRLCPSRLDPLNDEDDEESEWENLPEAEMGGAAEYVADRLATTSLGAAESDSSAAAPRSATAVESQSQAAPGVSPTDPRPGRELQATSSEAAPKVAPEPRAPTPAEAYTSAPPAASEPPAAAPVAPVASIPSAPAAPAPAAPAPAPAPSSGLGFNKIAIRDAGLSLLAAHRENRINVKGSKVDVVAHTTRIDTDATSVTLVREGKLEFLTLHGISAKILNTKRDMRMFASKTENWILVEGCFLNINPGEHVLAMDGV